MRSTPYYLWVLVTGCGLDPLMRDPAVSGDTRFPSMDSVDTAVEPGPGNGGNDGGDGNGQPNTPRPPSFGDLAISELMINPNAVGDEFGEWIELANLTENRLELSGIRLSDDGVDGTTIVGDPIMEPGARIVFCAAGSTAHNGGVECDATYRYSSLGEGMALANTADEVVVSGADGSLLDRVDYASGFAPAGRSTGVRAARLGPTQNDSMDAWCPQNGGLPGGDQGTPGRTNSEC